MTRSLKWTLALALGLTGFVLAQGPPPGVFGPNIVLFPAVQKELKMSDDQVGKAKDALSKVWNNHKEDIGKVRTKSQEERMKLFKTITAESRDAVAGILDKEQMKRFQQISWQIAGPQALQDPHLQKKLKVNDEQKKKLDKIFTAAGAKVQELIRNREKSPAKYQEVHKEVTAQIDKVLSDEQKKNFKELKGKPFAFGPPPPREKR